MFFLKFLFVLLLIVFVVLLAYTIYTKVKNPEKSIMSCIPFMDDFSQVDSTDVSDEATAKDVNTSDQAESLKVTTATKVTEKPKVAAVKKASSAPKTKAKPAAKANTSAKAASAKTATKAKAAPKKAVKPKAASKPKATKAKTTKAKGDNIKKINGIGPVFEKKLNAAGINSFAQIAAWTAKEAEHMDEQLELSGRPQREEWVAKAKILAAAKKA